MTVCAAEVVHDRVQKLVCASDLSLRSLYEHLITNALPWDKTNSYLPNATNLHILTAKFHFFFCIFCIICNHCIVYIKTLIHKLKLISQAQGLAQQHFLFCDSPLCRLSLIGMPKIFNCIAREHNRILGSRQSDLMPTPL